MEPGRQSFGEQAVAARRKAALGFESTRAAGTPAEKERRLKLLESKMKSAVEQAAARGEIPKAMPEDKAALYARRKAAVMELLNDPRLELESMDDLNDLVAGTMDKSLELGEDPLRADLRYDKEIVEAAAEKINQRQLRVLDAYVRSVLEVDVDLEHARELANKFGGASSLSNFYDLLETDGFYDHYLDVVRSRIPSAEMQRLVFDAIQKKDWRAAISGWAAHPESMSHLPAEVKKALPYFLRRLFEAEDKKLEEEPWPLDRVRREQAVRELEEGAEKLTGLPELKKTFEDWKKWLGQGQDAGRIQPSEPREIEQLPSLAETDRAEHRKLYGKLFKEVPFYVQQWPGLFKYRGEVGMQLAKQLAEAAVEEMVAKREAEGWMGYEDRRKFIMKTISDVARRMSSWTDSQIPYTRIEDYLSDRWTRVDLPQEEKMAA